MARSISQIYAQAIYTRNSYLQITELDSGRTSSKMSILNLITYVMSAMIYVYEVALDVFQVDIAKIIANRINGTAPYYAAISKMFQFDPIKQLGDKLIFNEETYKIEYEELNESHRIIKQSSYEDFPQDNAIILKVCKANSNSNEVDNGTVYMPLSDAELTAFKQFISTIKFCGARIYCVSNPADIVLIHTGKNAAVYYDDNLVTKEQALQNIKNAIIDYVKSFGYDTYVHYQKIIDAIQNATGITDISSNVTIGIKQYNNETGKYSKEYDVTGRIRPGSGYIKFIDTDGLSTLNAIYLISESKRNEKTSVSTEELQPDVNWELNNGQWELATNEGITVNGGNKKPDTYTQITDKQADKLGLQEPTVQGQTTQNVGK